MLGIALVCLVGGFFGGTAYQKSKVQTLPFANGQNVRGIDRMQQGRQTGSGGMMQNRNGSGMGQNFGTITAIDDTSVTIKLQDGSSKIIVLSGTTTYAKETEGAKSDLKIGDTIGVFGTITAEGATTAQSVQINPMMRNQTREPNGTK